MKCRILGLTNLFPNRLDNNRATFNLQQFTYLGKRHDVSMLVPLAWTSMFGSGINIRKMLMRESRPGLVVDYFLYLYVPGFLRFSYGITMFLSMLIRMSTIRTGRPDLIYCTWAYPDSLACVLLGKILSIPVIAKVHGSDINELPKIPGVGIQIKWMLNNVQAIISVSQDLARKIRPMVNDKSKINVIYNGVDHQIFHPMSQVKARKSLGIDGTAPVVLFVGNLKEAKGCLDMYEGFKRFLQQEGTAKLVLIGNGPCEDKLITRIKADDLADSVTLAGSQGHDSLSVWYAASDVVCLPSHNEGVPNVLLEAMSCGKPVIASSVGGIPEIINENTGILINPHEHDQIASAISEALGKTWDYKKILRHASRYQWEKNIDEVDRLIREVIPTAYV